MKTLLLRALLALTVGVHAFFVVGVVVSFFVLPFKADWWIWIPFEVLIVNLIFGRGDCPVTRWENDLRKALGYKPIGGFVGHYFKRPVYRLLGLGRAVQKQRQQASAAASEH